MQKIKYFIATLFIFSFSFFSFSQGAWSAKSDMLTARKEISDAATVLNNKIYVLGGRTANGTVTNVFEMYDPATNLWTSLASYPLPIW